MRLKTQVRDGLRILLGLVFLFQISTGKADTANLTPSLDSVSPQPRAQKSGFFSKILANPKVEGVFKHGTPFEKPFRARTQEECGTVDLRDQMSLELKEFFSHPRIEGSFGHDPKDDDAIGFCYAMSAADLLTYQTGRPASGLYLYLNYTHDLSLTGRAWRWGERVLVGQANPLFDGGTTSFALTQSLRPRGYGICEEAALPSSHRASLDGVDLPEAFSKLIAALRLAENGSPDYPELVKESGLQSVYVGLGQSSDQVLTKLDDLVYDYATERMSGINLLTRAAQEACAEHKIYSTARPSSVRSIGHNQSDILTPIDAQLDGIAREGTDGQVPDSRENTRSQSARKPNMVAILYDTGFTRTMQAKLLMGHYLGGHVSTIVGRKWSPERNRCEYQVRDSLFGTSCANYRTDTVRCVGDGTYWVSDSTMWDMTSWVTYIESPPQS